MRKTVTVPAEDEIKRQNGFMLEIKALNAKKETAPKFFINTFGCQMNAHDSEKIRGMLREMGYEPAEDEKGADFIIYNTCCVRENAENKVYGNLGYLKHAKKENPDMKIALCGCMMQQPTVIETIRQKYRHVDIVFGTFNLYKLPELIMTNIESGAPVFDIWEKHAEIVEDLPTVRKYKFKASVNIMFGCNNFCSYCIVPYVRGRERSRKPEDIIAEIKALAADGVKEVMLLGQNVNSYGRGLEEETSFARLLRMVNEIEDIKRIRFMTSHPKDLSDELIEAMADCGKVCNHLHLPFQAGSDRILEQMNRRYTKARYLELVDKVRSRIPDIALTTDIMVGFPGETEEDVLETIDVVKKVRFSSAFTFIYSKRTGTPAAAMENQIPEDEVKGYFNRLLDAVNPIVYEINQSKLGKTYEVLADDISGGDAEYLTGRTTDNTLVHFKGCPELIGELVNVKITESKPFYLIGEMQM
ncbi:MAG: tRNA (N6-isopentenyl adenosine(37)-C2)-methylthiotransferase MiaB [Firmicutes bacterium]|nr:tRNA (N6-isopentenyl adenosine(37)-C2)-methylthiotransferase MiaB [Bacillota bacterium]MBQ9604175.1 tRNA (N6-isopentenyl adenosine(37)-C2)-methylthiotransferase MiaB [Bacillota bacterium]